MGTASENEQELLLKLNGLKDRIDDMKESLSALQLEYDKAEGKLIEQLTERGAISTAKYEGIGFASLAKPRLYASYPKDNEEQVFEFVKAKEPELIKQSVHPSSLSSFVSRLLENGESIPESINYHLKQQIRIYRR